MTSIAKSRSQKKRTPQDAVQLLTADHAEVSALFRKYDKIADAHAPASDRQAHAEQICTLLTVHATIEEEIFYPAARLHGEDVRDLVDEAAVEHQTLKDIIARLRAAPSSDPLYDAGVKVLSEYVKHHVKEEENELFPKVRKSNADLVSLGERLAARKAELERNGGRQKRAA